jgi:hypothetical protein
MASRWISPFNRRHVFAAALTSLNTMSLAVFADRAAFVRTVDAAPSRTRCRLDLIYIPPGGSALYREKQIELLANFANQVVRVPGAAPHGREGAIRHSLCGEPR